MTINIIILILFIHWLADFVAQTHWQATNKYNNWLALIRNSNMKKLWMKPD